VEAVAVGDVVELRRAHPCGSSRFVVTMVGLDIRLSCTGCGARLILSRERLHSRLRAVHPFEEGSVNPLHRGEP
jgi:hypothetical protein